MELVIEIRVFILNEYPFVCLSYPLPSALADGQLGRYCNGFSHRL